MTMVDVVASLMSLFTLPVLLVCVVDDWFLRPRRQLRGTAAAPVDDPLLMKILYTLLPVPLRERGVQAVDLGLRHGPVGRAGTDGPPVHLAQDDRRFRPSSAAVLVRPAMPCLAAT